MDKHYLDQIMRRALGEVSSTKQTVGEPLWFRLEETLLNKKSSKDWNPAVFFPLGLAQYVLVDQRKDCFSNILNMNLVATHLAMHLTWNLTKGVYLFDLDLFEELIEAPLDRIPVHLLERLPEAAPLIVFPRPWNGMVATWVSLDEDMRKERKHLEFRALAMGEERSLLLPLPLDLVGSTFGECAAYTQQESMAIAGLPGLPEGIFNILRGILNLTLYLCSEEPDLAGKPRVLPPLVARSRYKRTYPDSSPNRIETGWRFGAALRKARAEAAEGQAPVGAGGGKTPQPHIRRGHWHLYWTGQGSRKDPSKAEAKIRWIQPILVGRSLITTFDDLPASVRKVKPEMLVEPKEDV